MFALERNRDHSVIFEIVPKSCTFVDYDSSSISSKGFLPTVVDIMVVWVKFAHSGPFSSLIPKMSMLLLPSLFYHFQFTLIHGPKKLEKIEWFYEDIQDLLELTLKKDIFFIIGAWNAKVGSQEIPEVTRYLIFDLGVQNETGQRLIELCQETALVIASTFFQQDKRWLYTWTSPDGQYKNQIDYILCSLMEKLYIVSKNKTRSWLCLRTSTQSYCQI